VPIDAFPTTEGEVLKLLERISQSAGFVERSRFYLSLLASPMHREEQFPRTFATVGNVEKAPLC
jgi:hypothetical protein